MKLATVLIIILANQGYWFGGLEGTVALRAAARGGLPAAEPLSPCAKSPNSQLNSRESARRLTNSRLFTPNGSPGESLEWETSSAWLKRRLRRMGPLENVLGMLPGMDRFKDSSIDEKQLRRVEAIILSMTRSERARPDLLNARRRQRVEAQRDLRDPPKRTLLPPHKPAQQRPGGG